MGWGDRGLDMERHAAPVVSGSPSAVLVAQVGAVIRREAANRRCRVYDAYVGAGLQIKGRLSEGWLGNMMALETKLLAEGKDACISA